jgi:hypothetical protein
MKITKQQELDYIVSITAGLLASGHFTYVRQDSKGAEVRQETIETAEHIWHNIKTLNGAEIGEPERLTDAERKQETDRILSVETEAPKAKQEARKGK